MAKVRDPETNLGLWRKLKQPFKVNLMLPKGRISNISQQSGPNRLISPAGKQSQTSSPSEMPMKSERETPVYMLYLQPLFMSKTSKVFSEVVRSVTFLWDHRDMHLMRTYRMAGLQKLSATDAPGIFLAKTCANGKSEKISKTT